MSMYVSSIRWDDMRSVKLMQDKYHPTCDEKQQPRKEQ